MSKYEKVKNFYKQGLWDAARVQNAVIKGWITEEEYKEITGEEYVENPSAKVTVSDCMDSLERFGVVYDES